MRSCRTSTSSKFYAKYLDTSAFISILISTETLFGLVNLKNVCKVSGIYPSIYLPFFFFLHVVFTYLLFTLLPPVHVQSCLITSFLNVFFLCVKYMSTVKRGGHSSAHSSAKSPGEPLLLWLCITSVSPPSPFTCGFGAVFVNIFKLETRFALDETET